VVHDCTHATGRCIQDGRLHAATSEDLAMSWFGNYIRSTIGAKHIMAVTGLLLLLFAIFHMLGHLQMFGGQDVYNGYAHFLQELWEVKWPTRVGLVALLRGSAGRWPSPG
jgi:hypothetical protein